MAAQGMGGGMGGPMGGMGMGGGMPRPQQRPAPQQSADSVTAESMDFWACPLLVRWETDWTGMDV